MKLYCVRHGEAETPDVNPERPLTEKGQIDVETVARFMGESGLHIDQMFYSPKKRATQTAMIFAKYLQADQVTECEPLLDEQNDVEPLMDIIPMWSQDTMLVGHLPFMYKLISALVLGKPEYYPIVNYPPGTIVCLDRYNNERWIICWLLSPEMVPGR